VTAQGGHRPPLQITLVDFVALCDGSEFAFYPVKGEHMRPNLRLIKTDSGRILDEQLPIAPSKLSAVSQEDIEMQELLDELLRREVRLEALRLMTGLKY
jgi:hypothetical protein